MRNRAYVKFSISILAYVAAGTGTPIAEICVAWVLLVKSSDLTSRWIIEFTRATALLGFLSERTRKV